MMLGPSTGNRGLLELIRLILKSVFRHKLRASLTILGVAIAMLAFGISGHWWALGMWC